MLSASDFRKLRNVQAKEIIKGSPSGADCSTRTLIPCVQPNSIRRAATSLSVKDFTVADVPADSWDNFDNAI